MNQNGAFEFLAGKLDEELRAHIENQGTARHQQWAFTRYDIVGHSQGGVLARMLCTENDPHSTAFPYFKTFRSQNNAFRGRFRRVITLNSPQNGSTLAYFESRIAQVCPLCLQGILEAWGILQPKFSPWGDQMTAINMTNWHIDSAAKFHLIGTSIYGGRTPLRNGPQMTAHPSYMCRASFACPCSHPILSIPQREQLFYLEVQMVSWTSTANLRETCRCRVIGQLTFRAPTSLIARQLGCSTSNKTMLLQQMRRSLLT